MTISKADLLADVDAIVEARDARDAAHAATNEALANVTSVTVTAQASVDVATAQAKLDTSAAQTSANAAAIVEDDAKVADQAALDKLVADITAFNTGV